MSEEKNLDKAIDELKKTSANLRPTQWIVDKTLERLGRIENERNRNTVKTHWAGILKTAAAAVLILSAGFFAGRLTRPAGIDPEQLAGLEKTLKSTLESEIRQNLQSKFAQDIQSLVKLNSVQLNDLATAVEMTQQRDRLLISAALKQMEQKRLNENDAMRNELVTYASLTEKKLAKTEESLEKLMEIGPRNNNTRNPTDNLK